MSLSSPKSEEETSASSPPADTGYNYGQFDHGFMNQGGYMMGDMGMSGMNGMSSGHTPYDHFYSFPSMGNSYGYPMSSPSNLNDAFQSLSMNHRMDSMQSNSALGAYDTESTPSSSATLAKPAVTTLDEMSSPILDELISDEQKAEAAAAAAAEETGEYDFDKLPPHACAYCGIHHPESVARCTACNKWFCNSSGVTSSSHLVAHMVRARHKVFTLHSESPLVETPLECYACGCRNVFLLGFVSAKADNVIVLLCRTPCLQAPQLKHSPWDLAGWTPLIQEKHVIDWLLTRPPQEAQERARPITAGLIARLEELWHSDPSAKLEDLQNTVVQQDSFEAVCVRFEDSVHYQHVMGPLVNLEADHDRRTKEMQSQDHVTVEWETLGDGASRRVLASFYFFQHEETALRVVPGDELRLSYGSEAEVGVGSWEGEGSVTRVTTEGRITVVLFAGVDAVPMDVRHGYRVQAKWKSVAFDRMQAALHTFASNPEIMGHNLCLQLLGITNTDEGVQCRVPDDLRVPGLPALNPYQAEAVRSVLLQTLSLVQGPPGTGKTSTCATIVYHLHRIHKRQVLVCAPSNVAVDHLTEKLHLTGLKVIRVASRSRESVPSTVDFLSLHVLLQQLALRSSSDFAHLHTRYTEDPSSLSPRQLRQYRSLVRKAEHAILSKADVVCTTCAGAGDLRLQGIRFERVVVDESTQAPEPECLVPIVSGAKQLILVGDHCQLGPVILSKTAVAAGFNRSLFERLILLGHQPHRLQIQYRMHPALSTFPSNTFYEGTLQNGVSAQDRTTQRSIFSWPVPSTPMAFIASAGVEEYAASGTSYLNRQEAAMVEKLVLHFVQNGVSPGQIGIITPYEGQRLHLLALLARSSSPVVAVLQQQLEQQQAQQAHKTRAGAAVDSTASILSALNDLEIASVDSFQGREKDFIIFACVRSNEHGDVGFLSDPRRLNVALTRARYGLILVGNPRVLAKQPLWNSLLVHFQRQGVLVEGSIGEWRPWSSALPQPRLCISKRTVRIPVGFDPHTAFGMGQVLRKARPARGGGHTGGKRGGGRGNGRDRDDNESSTAPTGGVFVPSAVPRTPVYEVPVDQQQAEQHRVQADEEPVSVPMPVTVPGQIRRKAADK